MIYNRSCEYWSSTSKVGPTSENLNGVHLPRVLIWVSVFSGHHYTADPSQVGLKLEGFRTTQPLYWIVEHVTRPQPTYYEFITLFESFDYLLIRATYEDQIIEEWSPEPGHLCLHFHKWESHVP